MTGKVNGIMSLPHCDKICHNVAGHVNSSILAIVLTIIGLFYEAMPQCPAACGGDRSHEANFFYLTIRKICSNLALTSLLKIMAL
jgi:hypothetical protein